MGQYKCKQNFVMTNLCQHFFRDFLLVPGDKGNAEPAFFFIEVGTAVPGELDRGSHFL